MFLKRLFGRQPKARDTRPDREQLIDIALNAPDSAARRDACHALADLPTLRRVATDDSNAGIRDLAAARYRKLLCGLDTPSSPLSERLTELAQVDAQDLIAHVATQATDAELRQAAIMKLTTPQALASAPSTMRSPPTDSAPQNACRTRPHWNRSRAGPPSATSASIAWPGSA